MPLTRKRYTVETPTGEQHDVTIVSGDTVRMEATARQRRIPPLKVDRDASEVAIEYTRDLIELHHALVRLGLTDAKFDVWMDEDWAYERQHETDPETGEPRDPAVDPTQRAGLTG